MLINAANMADLFRTYSTAFNAGQTSAQGRVGQNGILLSELALVIPSTGGSVNHAWLEQIRAMREWVGDRLLGNLKIGNLTVVNRKFENTVSVPRDAIEDDQYGVFAPLMGMMGDDAEALWLRLCIDALAANGNWADGNPFFCSARVLGKSTFTNAVTTALSATAFEAAMTAMGGFTLFGGEPAEVTRGEEHLGLQVAGAVPGGLARGGGIHREDQPPAPRGGGAHGRHRLDLPQEGGDGGVLWLGRQARHSSRRWGGPALAQRVVCGWRAGRSGL